MKKTHTTVLLLGLTILLSSCGNTHFTKETDSNLDTSSSETTISEKMTELYFDSIDDLAGYLIAYKDKEESLLFTLSSQKNPSEELTMYTPAFIPNDYELSEIRLSGYFISMYYDNIYNDNCITFVWGYKTLGEEYLKNAAEVFELKEMEKFPGYYESYAVDNNNIGIDQIYWEYAGNCFQANIPLEILDQILSDGELKIDVSSYSFSDNIEWSFAEENYLVYTYDQLVADLKENYPDTYIYEPTETVSSWEPIGCERANDIYMLSYLDDNNRIIKIDIGSPYGKYDDIHEYIEQYKDTFAPANNYKIMTESDKYIIESYDDFYLMTGITSDGTLFSLRVMDENGASVPEEELIYYYEIMNI